MSDRKKIMFYETPERQIEFRIRCEYEGVTQSQFLRYMVSGCIEKDPLLQKYLNNCKVKEGVQGNKNTSKRKSIQKKENKNIKKFGLNKDEIENIFDIIEVETNL